MNWKTIPEPKPRMELRRFDSTDSQVSMIGQGTWNIDKGDRDVAIAALRLGLDLGMTHIDTAEMYGDAEEIIAEAIEGRRNEVFLVSKVLPQNASLRGTIAACERSLARLNTGWLDCNLLHWRGKYPLEDTFEAFEQLQLQGKILSWGASNLHRCAGPRRSLGDRRRWPSRLQSGPLSLTRACHRTHRAPLVRGERSRRGGLRSVRSREISWPAHSRGSRAAGDCRRPRRDS